jgi:hypothetical protein
MCHYKNLDGFVFNGANATQSSGVSTAAILVIWMVVN